MRTRPAQNLLLLLLGGAVLVAVRTGEHLKYVRPSLTPLLVASGVLIVLLAVSTIARDYRLDQRDERVGAGAGGPDGGRTGGHGEGHAGDHADGHDSHGSHGGASSDGGCGHGGGNEGGHHGSGPVWALAAPIVVLLAVAPPAIGLNALDSNSARSGNAPARSIPVDLPEDAAPELPLPRVAQLAQPDSGADVAGRAFTVTGFLAPSRDGTGVDLVRVAILCCAADARTLRARLVGAAPVLPYGTWVEVEGTIAPGSATEESEWVPDFQATAMREIPKPEFEYATF